jgi:hypothetical protein
MIARNIRRASMRGSSAVKNWARVHVFRTGTAVLTLALLGLSFFYSPDLLTWWLRTTMRIIESIAGLLPYPWGDRVEIAMKALGGSFWFLITSAIIMVRVVFWLVAVGWRHRPSRQRSNVDGGAF